jgi:hypothetical protein
MTDTVRLRPRLEYGITSTASATSFATRPFEAASVAERLEGDGRSFYLKAGVAVPLGSVADLYFKPRMRRGMALGLFANNRSSHRNIENDLGVRPPSAESSDGGGVWFSRAWSRRRLDVDATYDRRAFNPYGVAASVDFLPVDAIATFSRNRNFVQDRAVDRFALGLGRVGVSFGDPFSDLSRFNFSVGVDGGYAHGSREARFDARVKMAKMFAGGTNGFELTLWERGAFGDRGAVEGPSPEVSTIDKYNRNMAGASSTVVAFEPRYLLRSGRLDVRLGADVRYLKSTSHGQNRVGVAPSAEVRYTAGAGFVPFVSYTSHTEAGDHEALSRLNPYVRGNGATGWVNDARAGFEGDVAGVFRYSLSGGASTFREHQLMVGEQPVYYNTAEDGSVNLDYAPLRFAPLAVDGSRYTVRTEVGLHNLGGFGARAWYEWNKFDFRQLADASFVPVSDLPRYEAGAELSYRHGDRFSLRLGARFVGERDYLVREAVRNSGIVFFDHGFIYQLPYVAGTLEPVVDVTFAADVRVARGAWAFLEGTNLAGQRLYPFPHYRGLGAGVAAGVKLVF